jgi:hypothetical protein
MYSESGAFNASGLKSGYMVRTFSLMELTKLLFESFIDCFYFAFMAVLFFTSHFIPALIMGVLAAVFNLITDKIKDQGALELYIIGDSFICIINLATLLIFRGV